MSGVGRAGVLEHAKSDIMVHIQRVLSHPVLVRISILDAKKIVSCLFCKRSQSVRCVYGMAEVRLLGKRMICQF